MKTYFCCKSSTGSKSAPARNMGNPIWSSATPLHTARILKFLFSPRQQLLCGAWGYSGCSTTACPGRLLLTAPCLFHARTGRLLQVTHILREQPCGPPSHTSRPVPPATTHRDHTHRSSAFIPAGQAAQEEMGYIKTVPWGILKLSKPGSRSSEERVGSHEPKMNGAFQSSY